MVNFTISLSLSLSLAASAPRVWQRERVRPHTCVSGAASSAASLLKPRRRVGRLPGKNAIPRRRICLPKTFRQKPSKPLSQPPSKPLWHTPRACLFGQTDTPTGNRCDPDNPMTYASEAGAPRETRSRIPRCTGNHDCKCSAVFGLCNSTATSLKIILGAETRGRAQALRVVGVPLCLS